MSYRDADNFVQKFLAELEEYKNRYRAAKRPKLLSYEQGMVDGINLTTRMCRDTLNRYHIDTARNRFS